MPRQVDRPALVGGLGRALGHRNFEPGEELPDVAAQHRGKREQPGGCRHPVHARFVLVSLLVGHANQVREALLRQTRGNA